ncbi:DUF2971 domain-containing protein [Rhizobium leucaenae]|uniref:DUF2971 domain-containing protein n=1 Tax=Rhizobium leucaenae TaxID=29450 RepID=A0A7W7ELG1_9HYPH|nr:DUF2971 domain-containing protein [Rhizobium leucaenae]MBB4568203.1 hypothetical protein [Rhizobium leucaenae]MBB6303210.1 hypothetical protein [Rhizobium leucaenae]
MKLYHYTTFSGALGILGSKSLWASCIHFLNDKEEFRHGIALASEIAEGRINTQGLNGKRLLGSIEKILHTVRRNFVCVASFAENGDLLSQWRGYAALGGVSLGFHKSALEAAGQRTHFKLLKCVYDDSDKIKIINNYLEPFLFELEEQQFSDENIWHLAEGWVAGFHVYASSFKDKSFAEENEWRLISDPTTIDHDKVRVRSGPGFPIPYFDLPLQQSLVEGQTDLGLDSIMIGPHSEQELAETAFSIAAVTKKIRVETFTRSSIPYRSV